MILYNLPIEPIEQRYSVQWDAWFKRKFLVNGLSFKTIYGEKYKKIEQGAFLDIIGTNIYKMTQMSNLCKNIKKNLDKLYQKKIVVFFHDIWFPGIESLSYIRDGLNMNIKIVGCLHAGTWDNADFLSKKNMGVWARELEQSWFKQIDKIFVATNFHKQLILKNRVVDKKKIEVTGFPIFQDFYISSQKENIVVFPHRLDEEKCPECFEKVKNKLQKEYPDWKFLMTKKECKTKKEYYKLLSKAKIAVSFAKQETWGIAMQEAVICGCIPIVPDRLSYKEMYLKEYKYESWDDMIFLLKKFMNKKIIDQKRLEEQKNKFLLSGENAIDLMIDKIRGL